MSSDATGRACTLLDHHCRRLSTRCVRILSEAGSASRPANGMHRRPAVARHQCSSLTELVIVQTSGNSRSLTIGGPDRVRTGGLVLDRDACWAATPRDRATRSYCIGGRAIARQLTAFRRRAARRTSASWRSASVRSPRVFSRMPRVPSVVRRKPASQRVGIVDRDQQRVDLVHRRRAAARSPPFRPAAACPARSAAARRPLRPGHSETAPARCPARRVGQRRRR